jgi:transposase
MVILLDNLTAHKTQRIKLVCAKFNHILLFNLAYSSRTNFIEYVFARLKQNMKFKSYKN